MTIAVRVDIPFGFTYDTEGRVVSYQDIDGLTGWYTYTRDSFGNLLSYTNYLGLWSTYSRDDQGNMLTYADQSARCDIQIARNPDYSFHSYKDTGGAWYEYRINTAGKPVAYSLKGAVNYALWLASPDFSP